MTNVKQSLDEIMKIDGAIGACLVDFKSGMALGATGGGPNLNIEVAAAGNTEVVRSKLKVMAALGLKDKMEDILISLTGQYHLIRMVGTNQNLFLYVAMKRESANLAMARYKLSEIEGQLAV